MSVWRPNISFNILLLTEHGFSNTLLRWLTITNRIIFELSPTFNWLLDFFPRLNCFSTFSRIGTIRIFSEKWPVDESAKKATPPMLLYGKVLYWISQWYQRAIKLLYLPVLWRGQFSSYIKFDYFYSFSRGIFSLKMRFIAAGANNILEKTYFTPIKLIWNNTLHNSK